MSDWSSDVCSSDLISGVVALMLEANPTLHWSDIKRILQDTATNVGGREAWEGGAGYVNAHAAVRAALGTRQYAETVNLNRTFNENAQIGRAPSGESWLKYVEVPGVPVTLKK